jgi:very-short-patch-repair endonuclease
MSGMSTRPELPGTLPSSFTVAQAAAAGVAPGRLRGAAHARPFHGVRVRGGIDFGSLEAACHALAPRLREGQFLSHETALFLVGVPMPEWPYRPAIHVSAYRPAREPRTRGVRGHRLQTREPAIITVRGLPVENPVRAWRQTGRSWTRTDLIAAADFLVSGDPPLADIDDLREEVRCMGDVRDGILMRALHDVRRGVRSPRETRLRLLLNQARLPEPDTGWNLYGRRGGFIAEIDLAYRRQLVAVEYDGRVHAEDDAQFARDADRWAAIRAEGWDHVRILAHHLSDGGRPAVTLVRDALIRAGWTPLH